MSQNTFVALDADALYTKLERMLVRLVSRFHRTYKGRMSWQELLAEADFAFMQAIRKWESGPKTSAPITYVYRKVWFALLDIVRREAREHARRPEVHLEDWGRIPQQALANLQDKLSLASQEAREVVAMVLDMPHQRRPSVRHLQQLITNALLDLGWASTKILETFGEIRDVLEDN